MLTLGRNGRISGGADRRIWFDRSDLSVSRLQSYAPHERLVSYIHYAEWKPVGNQIDYPLRLSLARPLEDYQLNLDVLGLKVNEPLSSERWRSRYPLV